MAKPESLPNHWAVVLALYCLEGWLSRIDTEDIAKKADEVAPGQFSWRKYEDQINIDNVRWALLDAKKKDAGELVVGSAKVGWMLTPAGYEFAKELANRYGKQGAVGKSRPRQNRKWRERERARMLAEVAYKKYREGRQNEISTRESERFFNLDDYVTGTHREERINRLASEFGHDAELGDAITYLKTTITR